MDETSELATRMAWHHSKGGSQTASPLHLFAMPDKFSLKISEIENPGEADNHSELLIEDPVKAVQEENARLRKLLAERDFDLAVVKKKWQEERVVYAAGGATGSDVAAAKIVELSRKVREITAELEREKTKSKQLLKALQDQEGIASKAKESAAFLEKTGDSNSPHNDNETSASSLQEKLQTTNNKLIEYRNLCLTLKKDLKVAQKALLLEVGDETMTRNALSSTGGWRGRAQQICFLQNKVAELKAQLEQRSPSLGDSSEGSVCAGSGSGEGVDNRQREQLRKLEKERREEHEKTQMDLQELKAEHEQMKAKLEGTKARSKVLHNESQVLKAKVATLVAKGEHDDELINTLTEQLKRMQESLQEHQRLENLAHHAQEAEVQSVHAQLDEDVARLRSIVRDREERIQQLEEELKEQNTVQSAGYRNNYKGEPSSPTMHGPSSAPLLRPMGELGSVVKRLGWRSADPSFPSPSDLSGRESSVEEGNEDLQASSELQEVKLMCQEYRLVAQATQVEKEKLLELVAVMNKRLETSASHALQAEQRVQELQLKNVQLEKQLGRASLELHPPRTGGGGSSRRGLKPRASVPVSQENPGEELKRSVDSLKEENATLRQALEEVVRAKEEDLRIYQDIIERTRLAFTDGLRQLRS